MDDARFDAVEADEAETAQNLFRREEPRQLFLVAQAVLQRDDGRVRANQRREQFRELVVGRGLQPDQHHVADADFLRCPGALGLNVKIAVDAADGHAFLPHGVEVGAEQEMDFLPDRDRAWRRRNCPGPTADDGDFH